MKEEILKRAMFAMPLSKEAQGTGIMSGFDMEEELDEDENADLEEMPPMARTPQNPEILMNTLRGDMRSVDARYMELAQMVGEEAAMETPPEVLAMLMGKMGAQQGGIGSLPQGQDMAPPGAQTPPPDQMGAPQPAPAMPQGGIPMPEGMESAPPFSQGAEAPQGYAYGGPVESTMPDNYGMDQMDYGDEMAPQGYAFGGLVRGAQFLGDKASQYGSAANAALGRMLMAPQPTLQRMTGGTPAMNLSVQGRESLMQTPAGSIVQGAGTQAGPYMSLGPLTAPTFTQGLRTGVAQVAERFPRAAEALKTAFPVLGFGAAAMQSIGGREQPSPEDAEKEARRQELINQIPTSGYPEAPLRPGEGPRPARPAAPPMMAQETAPAEAPADDRGAFITEKLGAFDKRQKDAGVEGAIKESAKPKTKMERIKEAQGEYNTMFSEILGDDKESAKINALLLLSEAGLKLASTRKPTFAMALADAASGLPRGLAAIGAQERELGIKAKSAALQQAISDVTSQDAAAAARQNMIAEYALKAEIERMKSQGVIFKDGGAGMLVGENKAGSRIGTYLDPAYVESVKQNPIALSFNEADANPFVRDLGPANTVVARDPKQRAKIEEDMNIIAGQLATVRSMKDVVAQAYSPGTFFTGVKNQYFVPLLPDAIVSPDVNKAQVVSILKNGFSDLARGRASQDGRLSVQQEKWQRENDEPVAKPDGLLQNPELAAKVLETKEKALLNEWYGSATKLGVFDRNRVIDTPPTGTKNDPFIMPTDPSSNAQMQAYLRATFGSVRNPSTKIYIRDQGSGKLFDLSVQDLGNLKSNRPFCMNFTLHFPFSFIFTVLSSTGRVKKSKEEPLTRRRNRMQILMGNL